MASSASATNSRLSVDDWVQEGFRVLAEDGVKALTLGNLCTRLGVTKGSFYWHFSDMTAYRTALVDTWAVSVTRTGPSIPSLLSRPGNGCRG
jgi:AcrR family transcriptional regulator